MFYDDKQKLTNKMINNLVITVKSSSSIFISTPKAFVHSLSYSSENCSASFVGLFMSLKSAIFGLLSVSWLDKTLLSLEKKNGDTEITQCTYRKKNYRQKKGVLMCNNSLFRSACIGLIADVFGNHFIIVCRFHGVPRRLSVKSKRSAIIHKLSVSC